MNTKHRNSEIAIVGIGCRFPHKVTSPEEFWALLVDGRDGIVDVPEGRWDVRRFMDPDPNKAGRLYVEQGGFLHQDIRQFDPMFFGISPREADFLDPQQRLLLEVAWEAIDNAGLDADSLIGSDTGVYIGGFMMDSMVTQLSPLNRDAIDSHTAVGFTLAMLANRISYTFDLRGPSISMDTACSGSLVATHLACQGIWNGECGIALVGGVNVMHRPEITMAMCKGKFLAKDGRSKSFDAAGDGYGRGEGAGVAVLKPLAAALAAGDRIYATIRATGCNQDGHTDGITVPNPDSQAALIQQVCARAGASVADIRLFEAHGTGTVVGDPLEAQALGRVVGKNRTPGDSCVVGSVKANIGHLEAAAGIAALVKTALSLHHGIVPPLANLKTSNPAIPFAELGLRLPLAPEPLPDDSRPCLAGVNSFGYGGTNAHVLMQRFNDPRPPIRCDAAPPYMLVASARDAGALKQYVERLREQIAQVETADFPDLLYSLARRRTHHHHRLALMTSAPAHALEHLDAWLAQGFDDAASEGQAPTHTKVAPVFVFTGMGPQWWGMGQQLYREEPIFRASVDRCDQVFRTLTGLSILEEMQASESESKMAQTQIAQAANFVIQAALVDLWAARGIRPAAIIGHSVGEVTAGYVAGCYGLEDAIRISYHRGRIQQKAAGQGGMLALGCGEAEAQARSAPYAEMVSIAAINSPDSITLAGDLEALGRIAAKAEAEGRFNRMLKVEVPYHSPAMEPLKAETRASLVDLQGTFPKIPFYSTVLGARVEGPVHDAEYWCDNIRNPVYFSRAISALVEDGHRLFLEIGPHPVLSTSIQQTLAGAGIQTRLVASLRRGEDEPTIFAKALADLYCAGCNPDWSALYPQGRFLAFPAYPWQRQEHWHETEAGRIDRLGAVAHPLLQRPLDAPGHVWESSLTPVFLPFLPDHKVQGLAILPGAAYVETALALQQEIFSGGPCILEELAFRRALVIDPADEPELRVEAGDDGAFRIYSRPRVRKSQWLLNAEGRISALMPRSPPALEHSAHLARCAAPKTPQAHYAEMKQRGLDYGPAFQGIAELWGGAGEVLARVVETDADGAARFNPAKLDVCFQSLLTALPAAGTYLPTGIRRFVYRRRPGREFWCYGRIVRLEADWIEAELSLYDAEGPLAEVLGLRCQAVPDALADGQDPARDWTYRLVWEPSEYPQRRLEAARFLVAELGEGIGLERSLKLEFGIGAESLRYGDSGAPADPRQRAAALMEALARRIPLSPGNAPAYHAVVLDFGAKSDWERPEIEPAALLLQVIQHLARVEQDAPRVYLVTRDAQAVVTGDGPTPDWGSLIGLMRVAANEHPALRPYVIDIEAGDTSADPVVAELLAHSAEDCAAWRSGKRYVQRLVRFPLGESGTPETPSVPIEAETPFVLRLERTKDLESIIPVVCNRSDPKAEEIEILVESCALLPRDLLALTRKLAEGGSTPSFYNGQPGSVAAGIVTRVGCATTGIAPGDRLVVCAPDAMRRYLICDPNAVYTLPIPEGMAADQAAVTVMPFLTALRAVEELGQAQAGETVLVHHTAGGLSLAAAQLAHNRGARVIATVRGEAGGELFAGLAETINVDLDELGSRVAALTGGRGVDLVIDSHSRLADLDVSVLAEFGRFISIPGSPPEHGETVAGLGEGHEISLTITNLDSLMATRRRHMREGLALLAERLTSGTYHGLPHRTFTLADLPDALLFLAESHWPGGIAIDLGCPVGARARQIQRDQALFRKDGSYLITGAFGGFGQALARWMAKGGAGELILASRRGASDPAAAELRQAIESLGCKVSIQAVDVSDPAQIQSLVERTTVPGRLPLRGVMHTAAVLDDAPLLELTAERLERVFAAKSRGAWNLHQATRNLAMDHFVLFSSVSALIGNAGQGNYVAANCILDSLAHYRRRLGLPAISINWGALGGVGMAASSDKLEQYLEGIGMRSFSADDALRTLGRVLAVDEAQVGILDLDWQRWKLAAAASAALPRFSQLVAASATRHWDPEVQALHEALAVLTPEERKTRVSELLVVTVAKVLRLPVDRVAPELGLANLGVDSLMNLDLVVALQRTFGVEIGSLELMQGGSLLHIADIVLRHIDGLSTADSPLMPPPANSAATLSNEEVLLQSLGSLNDADIERLLQELS